MSTIIYAEKHKWIKQFSHPNPIKIVSKKKKKKKNPIKKIKTKMFTNDFVTTLLT